MLITSSVSIVNLDWNLPRLIEDRATRSPGRLIVHGAGAELTYGDLWERARRVAGWLAANGVAKGDAVATMMSSTPDYLCIWIGISIAGAVEVPLNTAYKGEILRHVLVTAKVGIVIAGDQYRSIIEDAGRLGGHLKLVVDPAEPMSAAMPAEPPPLPDVADPACIMFTSGTTGPSKGAIITHHHLVSFGATFAQIVSLEEADTSYNFLPFFHIAGKFIFIAAVLANARMLIRSGFSASAFWDEVREHGVTVAVGVGGVCNMLLAQPPRPDDADHRLRLIYAVPVPHELKEQFETRFGCQLVEGYGSTETNIVAFTPPGATPAGSCGRASPMYEIRIVDEYDRDLPVGEAGEIVTRPRHPYLITVGYFGMPQQTVDVMRNFWFHTGDRGRLDSEGWLYFVDRSKDSLRRRGENISSYEVERIATSHPSIAEAAAVGVPSDVGEEEVRLVVVARGGHEVDPEELLKFCIERMPYFMAPRYIEVRTALPRTPTEKVMKFQLRAEGLSDATWDCEKAGWRITREGLKPLRNPKSAAMHGGTK